MALLLPVVQAIRDCETEGLIKVTRVAGTSAGAIAAALIAGRADTAALVDYLRSTARDTPDLLRRLEARLGSKVKADRGWLPIADEAARYVRAGLEDIRREIPATP